MNKYELALILPGDASAAKQKSTIEKLEKVLSVLKGKLGKAQDLGKVDLAYTIGGGNTGVFLTFPLELEADKVKAFDDKIRLDGDVLRYLLVRKDK